ncbi:Protein CBG27369 [Caenorhabditis briggsae]|uniref:Protein CBG27369 n=1 Tax=Caenorhabditis briggsae TaxID=6238 RepID=B6IGG9_CAEBR|nr:Protein CBG27369 [Caenorhabditis briggsae]CAR98999.1 Protein CBG27369 [Caenorhabditis briggsae]
MKKINSMKIEKTWKIEKKTENRGKREKRGNEVKLREKAIEKKLVVMKDNVLKPKLIIQLLRFSQFSTPPIDGFCKIETVRIKR